MAKKDDGRMKVIFFVALSFVLCCCGVKGDPERPQSKLGEDQIVSG